MPAPAEVAEVVDHIDQMIERTGRVQPCRDPRFVPSTNLGGGCMLGAGEQICL